MTLENQNSAPENLKDLSNGNLIDKLSDNKTKEDSKKELSKRFEENPEKIRKEFKKFFKGRISLMNYVVEHFADTCFDENKDGIVSNSELITQTNKLRSFPEVNLQFYKGKIIFTNPKTKEESIWGRNDSNSSDKYSFVDMLYPESKDCETNILPKDYDNLSFDDLMKSYEKIMKTGKELQLAMGKYDFYNESQDYIAKEVPFLLSKFDNFKDFERNFTDYTFKKIDANNFEIRLKNSSRDITLKYQKNPFDNKEGTISIWSGKLALCQIKGDKVILSDDVKDLSFDKKHKLLNNLRLEIRYLKDYYKEKVLIEEQKELSNELKADILKNLTK